MPPSHGYRFGSETRFGPYEILDRIGVGGMGEVYRARDTRLDRTVAIKVLTSSPADEHKARVRFEREARAISSLSHPHICAVYDVGHEGGVDYIVMEYLQGETLALRLDKRALRLDHALQYAAQIASALAEAHRAGIVHRDLKPGNVMLTPTGAKLLDFGLAKQRAAESVSTGTTPDTVTVEGQLVGTLPYMSPEQVEGKEADARSDIFAFGSMLHEMITHRRAFDGNQAHLIAAILSSHPPAPSSLQALCPPELDHVIARCLAKDPAERWQSALDLLLELKWAVARVPPIDGPRKRSLRTLGWAAAAAAASALIVAAVIRRTAEDPLPSGSPSRVTMAPGWESAPALSPDGSLIAYTSDESGNPDIWIVDVRGGNAIRLTDSPALDTDPAWFPDGSAVAFTSDRGGAREIWKVLRLGGAPTLLVPDARDAALSPDGSQIVFARAGATGQSRIWVAPMGDPARARVLTGDGDGLWDHRNPVFSPDSRTICYQAERDLWLVSADGRPAHRLTTDDEMDIEPAWSADGRSVHFASRRGGVWALWRVPSTGGAPRRATPGTGAERHPTLSRDGKRMAFATLSANPDLTVIDLTTRKETRLGGLNPTSPEWAPDGRTLLFTSARIGGRRDLWLQPFLNLDAAGPPQRLTDQPGQTNSPSFSPDGRWVAYYRVLAGQRDIWVVPTNGGHPIQFTDDTAADIHPTWAPDGAQIAFRSERGGMGRIWTAPIAEGRPAGPARPVTSGATADQAPAWSPDGRWIAYIGTTAGNASDVWITDATGSGRARKLATEGNALRVAWNSGNTALFVSGQWDSSVTLRRYAFESGQRIILDPPVVLGQDLGFIDFSVSGNGRFLAFVRDDISGDVWTLDSLDRPY